MTFRSKAEYESLAKMVGKYKLTNELIYIWRRKRNLKIVVPIGFKTDLASVPPPLRPFIPPDGSLWDDAAILHDFAVKCVHKNTPISGRRRITMKEADCLLYDAMRDLGASVFTAGLFYATVRFHHTIGG